MFNFIWLNLASKKYICICVFVFCFYYYYFRIISFCSNCFFFFFEKKKIESKWTRCSFASWTIATGCASNVHWMSTGDLNLQIEIMNYNVVIFINNIRCVQIAKTKSKNDSRWTCSLALCTMFGIETKVKISFVLFLHTKKCSFFIIIVKSLSRKWYFTSTRSIGCTSRKNCCRFCFKGNDYSFNFFFCFEIIFFKLNN